MVTANVDFLRRLAHDDEFAKLCRRATFLVADGMPLVWASRMQGRPLPERVAGSSLLHSLSTEAAKQNRSVFLLGGNPGTAVKTAALLEKNNPRLKIAGTCCPTIRQPFRPDERQIVQIVKTLKHVQPDIVYVGLGSPKQETLIAHLRELLPKIWWIGVGISFSYASGEIRRAPGWFQQLGFEWLTRLIQEPRRLAGRYLWKDLPFCVVLLLHSASLGIRRVLVKKN